MAINSSKRKSWDAISFLVEDPVDIASLAAFRFLFGLLMAAAMVRFISKGWVRQLYIDPPFHFSYPGFEWIHPFPATLMHIHFILLALLAVGVALGFFYRTCMAFFFLGFTYVELIDQTAYLNHYYLISLLSGLMIFLPANRAWSIDCLRRASKRVDAVPAWTLNLLRFQIGIVYIFAGLAKLNTDWLFKAEPLRIWLAVRSDLPLVGSWMNEVWVAYAASWVGAVFDSTVVFFLIWKRTRRPAYVLLIVFHVATWLLFNIGMFPWIMIVAATVFFPCDWPRYWASRLGSFFSKFKSTELRSLRFFCVKNNPHRILACGRRGVLLFLLSGYAVVQTALPLRAYFVSQPSAWTCAGFNCAWRVMIAEKTGHAEFFAFNPASGQRWKLPVKNYLTPRQELMMSQDPYLIRAMARELSADLKRRGLGYVEVQADAVATLNGRPSQHLINPNVNLAGPLQCNWILPLEF